jgi:hypothetical protein
VCVLGLRRAGVEPLVCAGEAEAPVLVEVAFADHGTQGEDGFGAVQAPACSGDIGPIADHSLNNQGPVEGFIIAAVQPVRATLGVPLWLMAEKRQLGEVGDHFASYVRFPQRPGWGPLDSA